MCSTPAKHLQRKQPCDFKIRIRIRICIRRKFEPGLSMLFKGYTRDFLLRIGANPLITSHHTMSV